MRDYPAFSSQMKRTKIKGGGKPLAAAEDSKGNARSVSTLTGAGEGEVLDDANHLELEEGEGAAQQVASSTKE
jgi:hypothetical protein